VDVRSASGSMKIFVGMFEVYCKKDCEVSQCQIYKILVSSSIEIYVLYKKEQSFKVGLNLFLKFCELRS